MLEAREAGLDELPRYGQGMVRLDMQPPAVLGKNVFRRVSPGVGGIGFAINGQ